MSEETKTVLTLFAAAAVIFLVILGLVRLLKGDGPHSSDGSLRVERIVVDNREITCVIYQGYRKGGLSCDWTNK